MAQRFFTGDVVKYVSREKYRFWTYGQEHIISECKYQGAGTFEYSTNRGAWFVDQDFVLVRKADFRSFKALDKSLAIDDEE